jgi:hypothetical protein
LRHSLSLHLLSIGSVQLLLFELLPAQIYQLLTRRPIAATSLPGQLEHLSLSGLFRGLVRGLAHRVVPCSRALIRYLKLLVTDTI